MDDVSVMWSPLESKDGPGRHSGKEGTDNRSTLNDTSLSRMCIDDATTTDDKQNGDVLRMQSVLPVQKSGIHISFYGITCFTVCALMFSGSAHGGAGHGTGLRFSQIGRELQNVECSSRTSRNTTGTTIPAGTATASFVFWNHGSGSTTGDRSNVSRQTAEDQGEQGSSDLARHNAEDLKSTGVLQSVRVWTEKTDDNADTWEAAIRHLNKVSVSSCFLMEIDKGCLQPSVCDDSILGEYIGSLVKNAAGVWEPAVKTNVSQNRCRVFGKSPWWDLSCDDDVWLHEQATMNRAQNSFVDEQLEQVQSAHDELRCYFADHKTMQIRPATTYDLSDKTRICLLDLRDAPNCEFEAIRQHVRNMKPYMLTAQYNDDSPNDDAIRALCEQQANQGSYLGHQYWRGTPSSLRLCKTSCGSCSGIRRRTIPADWFGATVGRYFLHHVANTVNWNTGKGGPQESRANQSGVTEEVVPDISNRSSNWSWLVHYVTQEQGEKLYGLFSKSYVFQRAKHDLYRCHPVQECCHDVYVLTSALALIWLTWKSEMETPLKH